MRSSVEQGALTKALIGNQAEQQALGFRQQASAYSGQADAARAQESGGFLSSVFKIAGAAFSLFGG
jgi:hypothetical protein